ncbi:MAG: hypothetical protein ABIN96_01785 [Rubrivivax sp.]
MKRWTRIGWLAYRVAALAFIGFSVFPLLYALATSFKQGPELLMPTLWSANPTTANYVQVFADQPFALNLLNSALVASSDASRTVPVAIALISTAGGFELTWGRIMAASVIVTLPLVALVVACQRLIVSGLSAGAVKG